LKKIDGSWLRYTSAMGVTTCRNGCKRSVYARKLCNPCYQRWRRTYAGEPLSGISEEQRFWSKVEKTDGCWTWTAAVSDNGYGVFGRPTRSAHCVAYELVVGPIPRGLEIDHRCHSMNSLCPGGDTCPHRRCVRPDHLEIVTTQINQHRSASVSGTNAAKTHCDHDHPFDEANTAITKDGRRRCRACARRRTAESRARQRDAPSAAVVTVQAAVRRPQRDQG
jgi:hypothetical protein